MSQQISPCIELLPEIRAAYFHPTGCRFDDLYGGRPIYSAELSVQTKGDLYTWFSVGYLSASDSAQGVETAFKMVPLGLGLKYFFCWGRLRPYLGMGVVSTWIDFELQGDADGDRVRQWGLGGVWKGGCLVRMPGCWFLDLFTDYTLMDIGLSGSSFGRAFFGNRADVSGFSFGIGIGYAL